MPTKINVFTISSSKRATASMVLLKTCVVCFDDWSLRALQQGSAGTVRSHPQEPCLSREDFLSGCGSASSIPNIVKFGMEYLSCLFSKEECTPPKLHKISATGGLTKLEVGALAAPGPENQDSQHMHKNQPRGSFPEFTRTSSIP